MTTRQRTLDESIPARPIGGKAAAKPRPKRRRLPQPTIPDANSPRPASASTPEPTQPRLDLRECKARARRLLPPGHPVLVVLESEPDELVGPGAVERAAFLLRLFLAHRRPSDSAA